MNNTGRTAITRKNLSLPMAYLLETAELQGECLDYGCGRGFDCDSTGMDGYDLNHRPEVPPGQYDTIICNYVLNVIPHHLDRLKVIRAILGLLKPGGVAFVSVRNDSFKEGYTSTGTWQGKVSVPFGTMVRKCAGYRMYEVRKSIFATIQD